MSFSLDYLHTFNAGRSNGASSRVIAIDRNVPVLDVARTPQVSQCFEPGCERQDDIGRITHVLQCSCFYSMNFLDN